MANVRLFMLLMAVRRCFLIKWEVLPSRSEIRIAGKAGTGEPSMSGEMALVGMMAPQLTLLKDITENCEMVLFWGCDPETTPWGFTGQFASRLCYFWSEVGIKQVYICPDLNYGAAVHADKWIPILPNTDAALQLAIAYIWITEGTYDKEYVKTHTVGFDKVCRLCHGQGRWCSQDTGVGLSKMRRPGMDH